MEQTVPNSNQRKPSQGERSGGRWDFVKEAVTNAVADELTVEIARAAMLEGKRGNHRERNQTTKQRVPLVGRRYAAQERGQGRGKRNAKETKK